MHTRKCQLRQRGLGSSWASGHCPSRPWAQPGLGFGGEAGWSSEMTRASLGRGRLLWWGWNCPMRLGKPAPLEKASFPLVGAGPPSGHYFLPDSKVNQLCIYRHSLFSRFFSHKVITQHWAELHGRSSSTWLVNTKWNVLTDCLGNGLRHRNVQVNAPLSVGAVPCCCYPSAWQELPRPPAPRAPCIQHVGTSWLSYHTADWLCSLFLWVCVHVCSVVLLGVCACVLSRVKNTGAAIRKWCQSTK